MFKYKPPPLFRLKVVCKIEAGAGGDYRETMVNVAVCSYGIPF